MTFNMLIMCMWIVLEIMYAVTWPRLLSAMVVGWRVLLCKSHRNNQQDAAM
jgi:hypothetical protein